MDELKPPRTRWVLFIIAVLSVIFSILFNLGLLLVGHLSLIGLIIDILGAVILVIPDIPSVNYIFLLGKSRIALQGLTRERGYPAVIELKPGVLDLEEDLGIEEEEINWISPVYLEPIKTIVAETLSLQPPRFDIDENDLEDVFAFVIDQTPNEKVIHIVADSQNPEIISTSPYGYLIDILEIEIIENLESKFRRNGIILIIFGFGLQASSILL